jgi:uncharacterized membrane protein
MASIINIIIIFIILLALDLPMLGFINKKMYLDHFHIINQEHIKVTNKTWISAIIVYCLLSIGLYKFSIKNNFDKHDSNRNKLMFDGMLFGLVVYSTYNFTNLATINKWGLHETIMDTIWGTLLCGSTAIISSYFININT